MDLETGMKPTTVPETGPISSKPESLGVDENYRSKSIHDGNHNLSAEAQTALQVCRAETGFDSYTAYLDFHGTNDAALSKLSARLKNVNEQTAASPSAWIGSVLNVSDTQRVSVNQIDQFGNSGTEIIGALSHPPEDTRVQVLLWNISRVDDFGLQKPLVDFLGLRFRLDPQIFVAILNAVGNRDSQRRRLDRQDHTHVKVGHVIACGCYLGNQRDGLPVVIIAGSFNESAWTILLDDASGQLRPCPSFSHSTVPELYSEAIPCEGINRYYRQMLLPLLERQHDCEGYSTCLPLLCILPLLQLDLVVARSDGCFLRQLFDVRQPMLHGDMIDDDNDDDTLHQVRTRLRSRIADMEDGWCRYVKYVERRFHCSPLAVPICQVYEQELKQAIAEANRLESQVRDNMQLQAGRLALRESRKSIEMSNRQIEESKRGKIPPPSSNVLVLIRSDSENLLDHYYVFAVIANTS
ncbi:MAG: hypothetical protein Q9170_007377 [Blastenia crenularia]